MKNGALRKPLGASSPCKGEERWGSAASRFSPPPEAALRARRLRRDATIAEKKLWSVLRQRQLSGWSFRRQHPIGQYIVDFYCALLKLAIELDGGQHNLAGRRSGDERRSAWLRGRGVIVLRFWNNDVLGNVEGVWEKIARVAATLSERPATPTPTLPLSGGGNAAMEVDR